MTIDYNKNVALHIAVQNKPKEWRLGQAYFNYAEELYPNEVNQLRGTVYDCFYDNKKIPEFLEKLNEKLLEFDGCTITSGRHKHQHMNNMVFEIYNADGHVRSAEIKSLEDIQNLPERFKLTNECCWKPPYETIVNFEKKQIRIYDYYVE